MWARTKEVAGLLVGAALLAALTKHRSSQAKTDLQAVDLDLRTLASAAGGAADPVRLQSCISPEALSAIIMEGLLRKESQ